MLILSTSILYYAPTSLNGIQNMVSTGPCTQPVTNASGLGSAFLSRANLSRTILSEANLSEANLSEADLSEADLSEADLRMADSI